jgi:parallel beta-helix repeat protein
VSGNFSHDNKGPGLWTDIDNVNTLYENNRVMNNEGAGIFHEISFDAVIRANTVTGNGFRRGSPGTAGALQGSPGIYIANSRNVTIEGNIVDGNRNGIVLTQHQREPGPRGQYLLQNVVVRANNITMTTGMSGFFYRSGSFSQLANAGITFSNNVYRLGGERLYFLWHNVPQTVQAWQAFGQDLQTTFAGEAAERPAF